MVRLMILDRDPEAVRDLASRASNRGWESHVLDSPVTRRLLVRMGIDALLVDPAVIDFDPWSWLTRVLASIPGLAVVVSAGPSTVEERIRALGLGVDDWLQKPSHPDELIERISAAVRRRREAEREPLTRLPLTARLEVDTAERRVRVAERSATLTERELEVLWVLMANQGLVVERESLFVQLWGYTMVPGDRSVDVHVHKIRAKLRRISPGWNYIHTQHRIGYRFQPEWVIG
jgi:DNA-binding response OmpR family regulator